MVINKNTQDVNSKFSIHSHIVNLISIAKLHNIDYVSVPMWDKSYPFVPSLYCNNLQEAKDIVDNLKQSMDISIKKGYLYYNKKIKGIKENDSERFIEIFILEINNISKIKYFGVSKGRAEEVLYKTGDSSDLITNELLRVYNRCDSKISFFDLDLTNLHKRFIKVTYYSFLKVLYSLKDKGFSTSINVTTSKNMLKKKSILFKRYIPIITTDYSIQIKYNTNSSRTN